MAAPARERRCTLYDCFCCWRRLCSPRIPRVAPGMDYVCIPAGGDDRPAWSLLVGFSTGGVLRLHRFRVAPSGRVLGRSDDALEILHDVGNDEAQDDSNPAVIISGSAARSPDGSSLCLFCEEFYRVDPFETVVPPRALQLQLQLDAGADKRIYSPPPRLPLERPTPCFPISAAGDIWAPTMHTLPCSSRLVMLRLVDEDHAGGRWLEAGAIDFSYEEDLIPRWRGSIFQGYAVVHNTILLSLGPSQLFFSFDCETCTWSTVTTSPASWYLTIQGRGVYVEEDDAIYFLVDTTIFAYRLDRQTLELMPPTMVDSLYPFCQKGNGFLAHLGGRLMCAVWITKGHKCPCDHLHVIISTFQPRCHWSAVSDGIELLHSTCRRLDMLPFEPIAHISGFCFLQEYVEYSHENTMAPSTLLEGIEEEPTSSFIVESSKMRDCCREFLYKPQKQRYCVLEEPAVKINKALYIVLQAASRSILYVSNIVDGKLTCHDNPLIPHHTIDTLGSQWHFICTSSHIYVVSNTLDDIYEFNMRRNSSSLIKTSRPIGVPFAIVLLVGDTMVAVSHDLKVFLFIPSTCCWKHCWTEGPDIARSMKINLSGYAVLNDNAFIVSDNDSCRCFFLDLNSREWVDVLPYEISKSSPFNGNELANIVFGRHCLDGRCVYVEGFIYTCSREGLVAYEILEGDVALYLSIPIVLEFPWCKMWERQTLRLDYARKDTPSGAIIFCVVGGAANFSSRRGLDVHITTVQVKTKRTNDGKMKPVDVEHLDIGICFILRGEEEEEEYLDTRTCFAVGS